MKLVTKTASALAVVVVLSAGLNIAMVRYVVLPGFLHLEQNEAQEDVSRVHDAIRNEVGHLSRFLKDWAAWNDTYDYVISRNNDYTDSNLVMTSFIDNRLDLIFLYDTAGNVVWGRGVDLRTTRDRSFADFPLDGPPRQGRLLKHDALDSVVTGVVRTEHGPMLIASRPVLTSENKGPIRGTMIMGRILDEEGVRAISAQVHVPLEAWLVGDAGVSPTQESLARQAEEAGGTIIREVSDRTLEAYFLVTNLEGAPVVLVRALLTRDVMAVGGEAFRFALAFLVLVGAITLVVVLALMHVLVLRPLADLTGHVVKVGSSSDLHEKLKLRRSDEFGILAREFNAMLENLAEARRQVREQSYRAGLAEMAAGVLHNVRNALGPILVRTERLIDHCHAPDDPHAEVAARELEDTSTPPERKARLAQYLVLSRRDLARVNVGMSEDLREIADGVVRIDALLAAQEEIGNPGTRPSERSSVAEAVREAVIMLRRHGHERPLVTVDSGLREAPSVVASPVGLVHVFSNLLVNAAEAVEEAGVVPGRILIQSDIDLGPDGRMVHVTVRDNGVGIPADALETVFGRELSTKTGGLVTAVRGLGLHWAANEVRRTGGRLYAESPGPGQGTTFHLLLPVWT